MELTLTKIFRSTKDKQGKPLKTSDGREYERVAIKAREYGDRWISGFGSRANAYWSEGEIVRVNIEEVEKDGKKYLNFSMPNMWDKLNELEARIAAIEESMLTPQIKAGLNERKEERPEDLDF